MTNEKVGGDVEKSNAFSIHIGPETKLWYVEMMTIDLLWLIQQNKYYSNSQHLQSPVGKVRSTA